MAVFHHRKRVPGNQSSHTCLPVILTGKTLHRPDGPSSPGVARSSERRQREAHKVEFGSTGVSIQSEVPSEGSTALQMPFLMTGQLVAIRRTGSGDP